jgi:hypothetical protein
MKQEYQQPPSDMTFMAGDVATALMAGEAARQIHTPSQDERPR